MTIKKGKVDLIPPSFFCAHFRDILYRHNHLVEMGFNDVFMTCQVDKVLIALNYTGPYLHWVCLHQHFGT